ncbi:ABC transporter permease [Clavibacter michiganensis]|uniref:ABC transporter permease n=1 Tax=Clavibacter michiganensis subsp. insidiosus TaxID=33014 RepID=A0A0D5CHU9_9MICO|nr:ABC transporter permease subunit [Clavibacter michiganensis]AJW78875.1 ABC transporter permease [Clavibacter michiganensis subsp. insidiosus]AWF98456.1 ABC transporter permease [Clavibacter michiganensis subsp. insidiosus]AWG01345.1 ABC transporter permease [Clavibacter michiganensis subsp. insidiosus]OQJ60113.1 ABC transporter permease [Clavibacter michiganensis subsp. insidiosus]RII86495.1 ABC transporter permease subunit [Clavibacter michiganensis subsp. insidiosus]
MNWVIANIQTVLDLTVAHVTLSVVPVLLGLVISLPLGWLANRYRRSRGALLTLGGALYTIPSIALLLAMPAILGTNILDPLNIVVALTVYAVALMIRITSDALASVSQDVKQSATAMGYAGWARFWRVELPLAGPVLLAGLRVVSVSTVSMVTVGSLSGIQSLGTMILTGYRRQFYTEIITGIVGIVVIALVFDLILLVAGRLLMPWSAQPSLRARTRAARRASLVTDASAS